MIWISEYTWYFLTPVLTLFLIFGGGWLSDNAPGAWKHKRWTRSQTTGAMIIGPVAGFMITGVGMICSLWSQPFVFERWWVAMSFIVISIYLFRRFCVSSLDPSQLHIYTSDEVVE